jgi:hypothetical protein
LISSLAKVSARSARSLIWVLKWVSFKKAEAGSVTTEINLARGETPLKGLLHDNPEVANEIEGKIRAKLVEMQTVGAN